VIKNKILRIVLLGALVWVVPFVVAFGFYDRSGQLTVSYGLFKCVMIVVSSLTSCYALLRHYKFIRQDFFRQGLVTGLLWLVINLLLDLFILVPMAKISFGTYFTTIGLGYLQIPVICFTVGLLLERQFKMNLK
jgi:hypothetical protein